MMIFVSIKGLDFPTSNHDMVRKGTDHTYHVGETVASQGLNGMPESRAKANN